MGLHGEEGALTLILVAHFFEEGFGELDTFVFGVLSAFVFDSDVAV